MLLLNMAVSSLSLGCASTTISKKLNVAHSNELPRACAFSASNTVTCFRDTTFNEESNCKRRLLVFGVGTLMATSLLANSLFVEETKKLSSFCRQSRWVFVLLPLGLEGI